MRVKRGLVSKRKHNKIFDLTKGYRGSRNRLIRTAKQSVIQAGAYSFAGRKNRKRDFRALWITRISEAVKEYGVSYSKFVKQLKTAQVNLNRKMLADLVLNDKESFKKVVEAVKA